MATTFSPAFLEVLKHEGVVSVTSWTSEGAHVANTWNSYLRLTDDGRILLPAAWFTHTRKNIAVQDRVIVTLGSKEVEGKMGMGTGFVVEGTARALSEGPEFAMMKEQFPFLNNVLEITPTSVRQTI